jgi:chemotaxis protein CheY-P-specific phosphatase CheC
MDNQKRESFLIQVMNEGLKRAAASFSKLINKNVKISNSQSILVRHDDDFSYISEEQGDLHILITHIIGEISGKSFLIFNQDESTEIFKAIGSNGKDDQLNEALLLEVDNILSASVISELSNSLDLEIYGDVPQLVKIHSQNLQQFMDGEVNKNDPSSIIFSNTTFQFEKKERIHPQFIWKMSTKIFELIPIEKISIHYEK